MKNTPSIAIMLPKNSAWLTGAAPIALERCATFAPSTPQTMNRAGRQVSTAAVNTSVMIFGGDLGSERKMWWISFCASYRTLFSDDGKGLAGSGFISTRNASPEYGVDDPKLPITMEAFRGCGACRRARGICENEISTFAFPDSFTEKGKDSASSLSPMEGGPESVRKAWCGLRPLPEFVVERIILRVEDCESSTGLESRAFGLNLFSVFQYHLKKQENVCEEEGEKEMGWKTGHTLVSLHYQLHSLLKSRRVTHLRRTSLRLRPARNSRGIVGLLRRVGGALWAELSRGWLYEGSGSR